jgi:hypothetical protein
MSLMEKNYLKAPIRAIKYVKLEDANGSNEILFWG